MSAKWELKRNDPHFIPCELSVWVSKQAVQEASPQNNSIKKKKGEKKRQKSVQCFQGLYLKETAASSLANGDEKSLLTIAITWEDWCQFLHALLVINLSEK